MRSKPTSLARAAFLRPGLLPHADVRAWTWIVATALCGLFWLGVHELVFG